MKHYLFYFTMFLCVTTSYGQYYEEQDAFVSLGKPYPVIDASKKHYFHHNSEILTVKVNKKKRIFLQKMDADKLSFIKAREYKDLPLYYQLEGVEEFNNRFYLFYSDWDGSNKQEMLFAREIDFAEGAFIGKGEKIVNVEGKITGTTISGGIWNLEVADKFNFQRSFDNSKLLVHYRMKPEKKRDAVNHDVIGLSVFDQNLNPLWQKEVEMPYTEKKMDILDYSIDSDGNTYILAKVYKDDSTDDKKRGQDGANYHIELLRVKANSSDFVSTMIALENKFISDLALFETPDNYMTCAGFYNKGNKVGNANGILMFKVGSEGSIYDIKEYEIPLEILNLYTNRKEKRKNVKEEAKGKAEFEHLNMTELLIHENGSILLIGEQRYKIIHRYASQNGGTNIQQTFHYNDLLVTKISSEGEFVWMKKLPKSQKGYKGMGGMSYKHIAGKEYHYIVFLDNVKNIDLPLDAAPAEHIDEQGGFLTAYKVNDKTGETTKTSLLDTRDVKGTEVFQFMTNRIVPLTRENEFVFEVYKKKKEDILIKVAIVD